MNHSTLGSFQSETVSRPGATSTGRLVSTRPASRSLSLPFMLGASATIFAVTVLFTAAFGGTASADSRPIPGADALTVEANESFTLDMCANDVPGDGATTVVSTAGLPDGVSRSGCVLSGATVACENNLIWYFSTDEDGDGAWGRVDLFVDCSNIDRIPVPETDYLRNFFKDLPASFDLCANDDLGDQPTTVSYSTTLPDGLTRNGCIVSGVPTECAAAANFFYWLQDANGDTGYTFSTITVRCTPRPEPDLFEMQQGVPFTANVCTNDYLADEPTNTVYALGLPIGIGLQDCILSGTPLECGTFTSFYWLRDRDSDRQSTTITSAIDCAPTITSSTLFFDDAENAGTWLVNPGGTDTGSGGVWQNGNPASVTTATGLLTQADITPSGLNAWVTGTSAGAAAAFDLDTGTTSVRSDVIDLPFGTEPTLEFDWYFAHGANAASNDQFSVLVSSATSAEVVLEVVGGPGGRPALWRHHAVSLAAFAGETIQITFRATDAGAESTIEAAFDNVKITQVPVAQTAAITAGPFAVTEVEYKLAASIQSDVRADLETELWARVYRPTDMSQGPYPVVMLMHGNHNTCGIGPFPRNDNNNQYATTGDCPTGWSPVQNHTGYGWLARPLAEEGYVVVSVNTNLGINGLPGLVGDDGLVLTRGRLLLRHLEALHNWNTVGGAPASLGLGSSGLVDRLDLSEVGFVGHSRGGEGVRAAFNLYRDVGSPWPARIPGLDVKAIAEIAPVDQLSDRSLDVSGTAWLGVLPMCDLDEPAWKAFNVMARAIQNPNENPATVKALMAVWGADHNGYNTEWHLNDTDAFNGSCAGDQNEQINDPLGSTDEQTISALAGIASLMRANVGANADTSFLQALDPLYALPAPVNNAARVDRVFVNTPGSGLVLDDFSNLNGFSPSGQPHQISNVTINHVAAPAVLGQASAQPAADIRWNATGANVFFETNWTSLGSGRDVSAHEVLEFRIGRANAAATVSNPNFSIQLVSADGSLSQSVELATRATVWNMAGAELNSLSFDHPILQTVRIPLSDFDAVGLADVRGVRFTFDDTGGAVLLSDLRFSAGITFAENGAPEETDGTGDSTPITGDSANLAPAWVDPQAQVEATAALSTIRVQAPAPIAATSGLPRLEAGSLVSSLGGVDPADPTVMIFLADAEAIAAVADGTPVQLTVAGQTLAGTWTAGAAIPVG